MKLARWDWVPMVAIATGSAVCVAVTGAFLHEASHDHDVEVVEDLHFAGTASLVEEISVRESRESLPTESSGTATLRLKSSESGVGSTVRIHGTTMQRSEPLIYIDGVRADGNRAMLDAIEPSDIERIEVLKGSAALSLYGEEAADGVVQIFLKKNREDEGG